MCNVKDIDSLTRALAEVDDKAAGLEFRCAVHNQPDNYGFRGEVYSGRMANLY